MNLDELHAEEAVPSPERQAHHIAFLPFLRIDHGYSVAGIDFLPFRDGAGNIPRTLESADKPLKRILSGYVDRRGKPFDNCVVATIADKGWDISKGDGPTVAWAASLLFLASWAANDYASPFGGRYINSTTFRLVRQAYTGPVPHFIAVSARRRDGSSLDGGYKHGELKFPLPMQCSLRDSARIDEPFLTALNAADAAGTPTITRLRTALPFVELANTDDDFLALHAEAILMGSAFEQLLAGKVTAYKLGRTFGALLGQFGGVTVTDATTTRPHIEIDSTSSERGAAQLKWWVHRKWMEELYDARSAIVHRGAVEGRSWGWTLFEHLVMAAHVFPLTVKLLLQKEGHYTLTERDHIACATVDKVLASPQWWPNDDDLESDNTWSRIASHTYLRVATERAIRAYKKQHPEAFSGGNEAESK